MTKLRRIEVEPLSEQRWSKLERSLFVRLERETSVAPDVGRLGTPASRRRWLAVVAAAAALVVVLFVVLDRPSHSADVEMPSRITTGSDTSHLALVGLSLDVEPESAVVVGPDTSQGMLIV